MLEARLRHVPKGIQNVERLIAASDRADLPAPARKALNLLADQLVDTQSRIEALTADIRADARANDAAQCLQTIPGVGPITASALVAALPDIAEFKSSRDLSAWLGLTPGPHSTGGRERRAVRLSDGSRSGPHRISKMGNSYLRRLLYLGAIAQVSASCQRHASSMAPGRTRRRLAVEGLRPVLPQSVPRTVCRVADRRELQRKQSKQAAIALANRMARTAYALMKNQTEFRAATAA